MISTKKKRILRAAACIACTVTIASVNTMVYAEPSTTELEDTTSGLQNELDDLNSQLSSLSTELNEASSQIEAKAAEVEKAKLDLAAAKLNEDGQYDAMKARIQFMYEGGSASLLEILFSSESMADFLNKAEFISTISEYDRKMLDDLTVVRADIEEKQKGLETQQTELASMQKSLTSKQNALNEKIASTSGELSNYTEQLERAKAAEAAVSSAQSKDTTTVGGGAMNTGNSSVATTEEVAILAAVLESEAGTSNYNGLLAVATVVMNRVESPRFPNTIYGVITQPNQFSPVDSGRLAQILARGPAPLACQVANETLAGARHSAVLHCFSFRAHWTGVPGITIGGNTFF